MMPYGTAEKRREYHREYMRGRYKNESSFRRKHLKLMRALKARRKSEARLLLVAFRANGCALCPEKEPCCLSAHHRNPRYKKFAVGSGRLGTRSLKAFIAELKKCVCLCENCHRKVHAGVLHLRDVAKR